METRDKWANTLKMLREREEHVLLSAVSNLSVSFTHDSIILTASNQSVFEILKDNKNLLPPETKIKRREKSERTKSVEQKLRDIFGNKLEIV